MIPKNTASEIDRIVRKFTFPFNGFTSSLRLELGDFEKLCRHLERERVGVELLTKVLPLMPNKAHALLTGKNRKSQSPTPEKP